MELPYIVAEVGLNHGGDFRTAVQMIRAAKAAGANAAKFQAVWASRLVSQNAPPYFEQRGEAATSQWEFFNRSDKLTRRHYEQLWGVCCDEGIDFLCTPFDVESVTWLNPLVPAFKIASADITNIPLLEAVAKTGKPVYLSTGAANDGEVFHAASILDRHGDNHLVTLLHCVLSYPTPVGQANLGVIREWRGGTRFSYGYSDHTLFNLDVLTTAWLLGATVIEKHFTLDKTLPGNDHYHSMDPTDLRALVAKFKELQAMIGDGEKRVLPCEEAARLNARQSWHAARDLPAGHVLQPGDLVLKRPGTGMPPGDIYASSGRTIRVGVLCDEPVTRDHLSTEAAVAA